MEPRRPNRSVIDPKVRQVGFFAPPDRTNLKIILNPNNLHSSNYAPYPKLDSNDVTPPPSTAAENWTSVPVGSQPPPPPPHTEHPIETPRSSEVHQGPAPISGSSAITMTTEFNPYMSPAPVQSSAMKNKMDSVKDVLGKWGKKAAEATKKAEDYAGNVWQHFGTPTGGANVRHWMLYRNGCFQLNPSICYDVLRSSGFS